MRRLRLDGLDRRLETGGWLRPRGTSGLRGGWRRGPRGGDRRKVWQRINIHSVGALLSEVLHVHALLCLDEGYELVTVLADDDGPEVAGRVVPSDPVVELVVEDGEASFIVELLKALDCDSNIVRGVDWSLLVTLPVVWLWLSFFSRVAPKCFWMRLISGRDPSIICASPKPSVHVNWL